MECTRVLKKHVGHVLLFALLLRWKARFRTARQLELLTICGSPETRNKGCSSLQHRCGGNFADGYESEAEDGSRLGCEQCGLCGQCSTLQCSTGSRRVPSKSEFSALPKTLRWDDSLATRAIAIRP